MNSVTGLVKPECRVVLRQRRFYVTQIRRKKEHNSVSSELCSLLKTMDTQTKPEKNQNVNCNPQRVNEFNIQMLSKSLHEHLYREKVQGKVCSAFLEKAKKILRNYGLGMPSNYQNDIELKLPQLRGDIEEHFWSIGNEQSEPYRKLLEKVRTEGFPDPPEVWVFQSGWTKYARNMKPVQVQYPDEDALVLDVEVCLKIGKGPTLATAVSSTAWYGWVSPLIFEASKSHQATDLKYLIPFLQTDKPSIVVGHSVSYDRARIREEYNLENSGLRFLDTMALHISIGEIFSKRQNFTSYVSLKDLYQFYCNKNLEKQRRSTFITGELLDIKTDFQNLMMYCANDCKATYEVFQVVYPKFLERFPHPVTLAGMLEMSVPYLPVNHNWSRYLTTSDETQDDLKYEMLRLISKKTDTTCQLLHNNEYKNDLWMWGEKWKTQELKLRKNKSKLLVNNEEDFVDEEERDLHNKFKYLFDLRDRLPQGQKLPILPGYPLWYRHLHKSSKDLRLSPGKNIMPKLLRIKWENFPVHYMPRLGWGILVPDVHAKNVETSIPFEKLKELTVKNLNLDLKNLDPSETYYKGYGVWCDVVLDDCCYFYKLWRSDNKEKCTSAIFSKDFTLSNAALSSEDTTTKKVLSISEKLSFWRECKSLLIDEMVVWLDDERGVILPGVMVCGTISRRSSDKIWLKTIPENAVGSELRSMIQAPTGYHIIGAHADLDLWIAALFGDSANMKIHGSTPLGWVTQNGFNQNISDILAKKCKLPLQQAKFLASCRLNAGGPSMMVKQLKKLNPNLTLVETKRIARKICRFTKGVRLCQMKTSKEIYFITKARQLSKAKGKILEDLFLKPFWWGGIESNTHNRLEALVSTEDPVTPFLSSRLGESLDESFVSKKLVSMIQSSGVDFLHLILVCMRWLTNGKARYCFSFHNEVRYLIPSEDRYKGALALHLSSLLVKAFCSQKLGIYDLPLSSAFFPRVGVDTTLRKNVSDDHVTPSNPHGLERGYGIAAGEELDIYDAIEKNGGKWVKFKKKKGSS